MAKIGTVKVIGRAKKIFSIILNMMPMEQSDFVTVIKIIYHIGNRSRYEFF